MNSSIYYCYILPLNFSFIQPAFCR